MYKLGLLLLVSGALCQHQVTERVQAPERQIRLEDIERDGLKSAAAQQTATYQQPAAYQQQQQAASYQQLQPQQQLAQPVLYQQQLAQPTVYQQHVALQAQQPAQNYFPQFQLSPAATAYQTPQIALHPQQLYQPGAATYQQQYLQPLYLQPQAHTSYNVPLMLIPYQFQQEFLLPGVPKLRTPAAAANSATPAAAQTQQQPASQVKFRPSPQIQYPSPYSSQTYQQKFSAGVKSTPAPVVKENYIQQQPGYSFKLQ